MQVHFVKRAYGMMDLSRKCMATRHTHTHILRRGLLGHIEVWIENSRIREKGTHFLFILYQLFWWSLKTSIFVKGCTYFFNLRLTPTGILVIISRLRSNAWESMVFTLYALLIYPKYYQYHPRVCNHPTKHAPAGKLMALLKYTASSG